MLKRITLNEAESFHGHLGPYLVLGLLAGEAALKLLGARKYFGIEAAVYGACVKPKSCLIDGIQLSTGATFGKGNIRKTSAPEIRIRFRNRETKKTITFFLKKGVIAALTKAKTHAQAESLARSLYAKKYADIFLVLVTS